jgi:hypothetical protein
MGMDRSAAVLKIRCPYAALTIVHAGIVTVLAHVAERELPHQHHQCFLFADARASSP